MPKYVSVMFALLCAAAMVPAIAVPPESQPIVPRGVPTERDFANGLIVKFRARISEAAAGSVAGRSMRELSDTAGVELSFVREMATGASVLRLPNAMPLPDVQAIARKIAGDTNVEYAEPDARVLPMLTPNDPQYLNQWHLTDYLGGINAPGAWDITTGSFNTVVAVLDTGYTEHPDLVARLLPGYDFITDSIKASDGDGRDSDAHDTGNWLTAAEKRTKARTHRNMRRMKSGAPAPRLVNLKVMPSDSVHAVQPAPRITPTFAAS